MIKLIAALLSGFSVVSKVLGVVAAWLFKSVWPMLLLLGAIVKYALENVRYYVGEFYESLNSLAYDVSDTPGVNEILANGFLFLNSFMPITEFFNMLIMLTEFWIACLIVRVIKGIKQTVLF